MLKIGWASADVSTNEPVTITGQAYERISKGSMDPTTITALYLEDGGDYVVFISGDFTSIEGQFLCEVKAAAEAKIPGFDASKIIFNATHTHTAPRYYNATGYDRAPKDRMNIYPAEKYRAFLLEQVVGIVAKAWETAAPGSVAFGYGTATIGISRRSTYFTDQGAGNVKGDTFAVNGHGVMYGKTDNPDFAGFEAGAENDVNLLFTFDPQGNLTGALVNVPCPSQCTEHEEFTSADYWNEARALIRQKYGNIFILPQCAAAGDLSPHLLVNLAARDRRMKLCYGDDPKAAKFSRPIEYYNRLFIAEKLARAFDEGFAWAQKEKLTEMPIRHVSKPMDLERWKVTEQQYLEAKENLAALLAGTFRCTDDAAADFKANTRRSCEIVRCENVIARYENPAETQQSQIHVLKIGDVAFATCPFELYIDFQHRIQARSPFTQTFFVQLTGSEMGATGYLATERAAVNKGYSAISFSCNVSPAGGQTLVEEILKTMEEIR